MTRKGAYVIDMTLWKHKDNKCTLCTNHHMGSKKQKLPLSVVDWTANKACSMKVSSRLHKSSDSLIRSSSSTVDNNWKFNLDLAVGNKSGSLMLAGTESTLANFSMRKTKSDRFSFISHFVTCEYYSYQVSTSPKLHRKFQEAVNKLPKTYSPENKQQYYRLINDYGTHYITKVKLGGSVQSVTSIRECQASLQGLSVEEVKKCLDVEASATIGSFAVNTESKLCAKIHQKKDGTSSFSEPFDDRYTEIKGGHTTNPDLLFSADKAKSAYKNWLNTLPQNPDIVSYSLATLHDLLPDNPVHNNLRKAISHYILEKSLLRDCRNPCQPGMYSDDKDPCVCHCRNVPNVNANCCPTNKGMAQVIITVQRATDLWGDYFTATDGYVKVFLNEILIKRSYVINNNNNPHWNLVIDMGSQDMSAVNTVRFQVWDQDNDWDDDLLGECEKDLIVGVKNGHCNLNDGRLYYKWEVKCAPSLTGEACMDYKPSPMSRRLRAVYVSRQSRPVPSATLRALGVFANK
ncbi:hypothetical protein LDENG_00279770 [Lucifuga dentata]|nr:hypothetical protein LDENG_00279770 [Lucifuga dentata]